jgi:hypothetical protein
VITGSRSAGASVVPPALRDYPATEPELVSVGRPSHDPARPRSAPPQPKRTSWCYSPSSVHGAPSAHRHARLTRRALRDAERRRETREGGAGGDIGHSARDLKVLWLAPRLVTGGQHAFC